MPDLADDLRILTAEELERLALVVPDQVAGATIPVYRRGKGKIHWAAPDSGCRNVPHHGPRQTPKPPPGTEHVPALGFPVAEADICRHCAPRLSVSADADRYVRVAAEVSRAARWADDSLEASGWSWTQFAAWRARQPLIGPQWDAEAGRLGARWKPAREALRAAVVDAQRGAAAVIARAADSITDDAPREALIERAIVMVGAESEAFLESASIAAVSTCPGVPKRDSLLYGESGTRPAGCFPRQQPSPWALVATEWRDACVQDRVLATEDLCAIIGHVYPHVHDLQALDCGPCRLEVEADDCVHSWASRIAAHHRHHIVEDWVQRLELAWHGLNVSSNASHEATHFLFVDGWPLTSIGRESLAYLTQFEIAVGPYALRDPDPYSYPSYRQVAVLRVPEWAAAHTSERNPGMKSEPISDAPGQEVLLARQCGVPVTVEEFGARRRPSRQVSLARTERDHLSRGVDGDGLPTYLGGYRYNSRFSRPLAPGQRPEVRYLGQAARDWDAVHVRWALAEEGSGFVYGFDQLDLLCLGLGEGDRFGRPVRLEVELQTGCLRHPQDGVHVCEVFGVLLGVDQTGAVRLRPADMKTTVTVPAPYLVSFTVER